MIDITLGCGESGQLLLCKVTGHAGYEQKGYDIVCAAVSVLVRVAILQLEEWAKDDTELKVSLGCQKAGFVSFEVLHSNEYSQEGLVHLFSFLKLGFESISCEYEDYVRLNVCWDRRS